MDAAFGDTGANVASEDRARLQAIHQQLGLDTFYDAEHGEKGGIGEKEDAGVHEEREGSKE